MVKPGAGMTLLTTKTMFDAKLDLEARAKVGKEEDGVQPRTPLSSRASTAASPWREERTRPVVRSPWKASSSPSTREAPTVDCG